MTIAAILLLIALICFIVAAIGANVGNVNLTALGLAFVAAALLAGTGLVG